jgi:hypothetical protein
METEQWAGVDRRRETVITVAVLEEKLKNLEAMLQKTDGKLKALERDRDSALKWGIMILGTAVVSMGAWIFKYITKSVS